MSKPNSKSPFTEADLQRAVDDLSMLRFFPGDQNTQAAVGRLLAQMCPHREALRWVVDTFVNRIGEWRGPTELRAVLCWRYRPQDGVDATSQIPGFTAADGEEMSYGRHQQLKAGGTLPSDPVVQRLVESARRIR